MTDFSGMRLGRKPNLHDTSIPRFDTLMALMAGAVALPPAPPAVDWTPKLVQPLGVMLNDQQGCCVPASMGHGLQVWTANAGSAQITVPDAAVEAVYSGACGYVVGQPSTDNGCYIDDVLDWVVANGIGGYKIDGFADFPTGRHDLVNDAVAFFGNCTIGINLPTAWQSTGTTWPAPPAGQRPVGMWLPGSWGGHCVVVLKYDPTGVWVISWGEIIFMPWAAWAIYVDQASVLLSKQWASAAGSPAGTAFPWAVLQADMMAFNAAPTPPAPPPVPPVPPPVPVPPNPGPVFPHHPIHHRPPPHHRR